MTSNSKELIELAERCEKASGPETQVEWEYPLEADIFEAVKGPAWDRLYRQGALPCGAPDETCRQYARQRAPRYTASLDAAMTLVPEGWYWQVGQGNHAWAAAYENPIPPSFRVDPIAATPALALCAAALRARATQSVSEDDTHER